MTRAEAMLYALSITVGRHHRPAGAYAGKPWERPDRIGDYHGRHRMCIHHDDLGAVLRTRAMVSEPRP